MIGNDNRQIKIKTMKMKDQTYRHKQNNSHPHISGNAIHAIQIIILNYFHTEK